MKIIDLLNKELLKDDFRSNDGVRIWELAKNDNISIALGELLQGEESKKHVMEMQEIYYIIEGKGEILVENRKVEITKGKIIIVPKLAVQKIRNTGEKPLKFLCIVNPAYDEKKETILE